MTVSTQLTKRIYAANGLTREWEVDFPLAGVQDLRVFITSPASHETEIYEGFEFNEETNTLCYPTDESEQEPLAQGWTITLVRRTPLTQEIDLLRQGELDAEVLEQGYDKLTMLVQELSEQIDRCIKYPVSAQTSQTDTQHFLADILAAKEAAGQASSQAVTSAQEAQSSAAQAQQTAQTVLTQIAQTGQGAVTQITQTGQGALSTLEQTGQGALDAVGQARQTAVQDIEDLSQTALTQINTLLDGLADLVHAQEFQEGLARKANVALDNLSAAGKTLGAGLAMPSNTYNTITLGPNRSTYTAPANGWFAVNAMNRVEQGCLFLFNQTTGVYSPLSRNSWDGGLLATLLPCRKGDVVQVNYDGLSSSTFRFYYAEGTKTN